MRAAGRSGVTLPRASFAAELQYAAHAAISFAALFQCVAAAVGGLRLVLDRMRQRGLDHVAGKGRAVAGPVPE